MCVVTVSTTSPDAPVRWASRGWSQNVIWLVLLAMFCSTVSVGAQAVSPSPDAEQSQEALIGAARARIESGQVREAVIMLQNAVEEDDGTDTPRLARRLGTLGLALNTAGALAEAIPVQHQALALYESIDDPADISAVTLSLGNSLFRLGDIAAARRYYEDALTLKRRHGIERGTGAIYNNLAELAEDDGNLEEARHAFEQALDTYVLEKNATGESLAHANLAQVLAKLGQIKAAQEQVLAADSLARSQESAGAVQATLAANAVVLMESLRHQTVTSTERAIILQRAEDSLQKLMAMTRAQANEPQLIRALDMLSRVRELQSRLPEALALAREVREREHAQTDRLNQARASVLSARYELSRNQRQIYRLRASQNDGAARIMRDQVVVWSLAVGLLLAVSGLFLLWRYNRVRRLGGEHQRALNTALTTALEQARAERLHAEAFAMRLRRFLRLASEDLRAPLQEIRSLAERALVEDSPDTLRRHHAGIAQRAADLIWVADQMLESTEDDPANLDAKRRVESVDLVHELHELVSEAAQRAIHRDQSLQLDCRVPIALVEIEKSRCLVALRELIDILLYLNPARTRLHFILEPQGREIRVGLDLGKARLPEWSDIALGQARGDVTLRLALAWIQHAIQDNGGHIETERLPGSESPMIVILFPQAPVSDL